jgi:tetratricopeptide (TPR) repeat protein
MGIRMRGGCARALLGLLALPGLAHAQTPAQTPAQPQAQQSQAQQTQPQQTQPQTPPAPPEALVAYFAQVRQAEAIQDPEQQCLAYPDLPDNAWPAGAAQTRCLLTRASPLPLAEIESRLAAPDGGAWLEQRLNAMLDANADPRERDRISSVFDPFDGGERAGSVATLWLRQMPESPFALTAMGKHRAAQGWTARGTQYAYKISDAQLQRMRQLFSGAALLLSDALKREPRLTPACVALAEIGRQSSDALQQESLAKCLRADPISYFVVWEWMNGAMPKWGGSMEAMNMVAAYIRQHGPENPMLYSLLSQPLGYEASQMDKYADGQEGFVAASRAGPGARMMTNAGHAYWAKDDPWMALVYWSQALRFWPKDTELRGWRGRGLYQVRDYEWALKDLLPATAADSSDLELQFFTGSTLLALGRSEESRPYLLRAQKLPRFQLAALERYCYTWANTWEGLKTRQARDCTAALVKQVPTHGGYWGWRYSVLSASRDEGWVEAAGQFLLHADPKDPRQQSLKKDLLASGVQPARSGGGKQVKP